MKELSIEEKAKAYDEAVEKLRNAFYDNNSRMCEEYRNAALKIIEPIFPELRESEDERIRKCLLSHFSRYQENEIFLNGITMKQIVAWLEKQGEQKETLCDKCRREQPSHSCQDITELGRCALEHQSKQKPDEVEPKFRVGDWVVSNRTNETYKINSIDAKDANYIIYSCVPSVYTDEDSPCFSESMIRLWTIQDAKDGDVLTTDTWTFIFKKYQDKSVYYHCAVSTFNNFSINDTGEFDSNYVHPTTKEQRDLLFKKMYEAGYEWDAKKKELKKIEQKPSWSEEDEKMLSDIDNYIKNLPLFYETIQVNGEERTTQQFVCSVKNWLKSLKERMKGE